MMRGLLEHHKLWIVSLALSLGVVALATATVQDSITRNVVDVERCVLVANRGNATATYVLVGHHCTP